MGLAEILLAFAALRQTIDTIKHLIETARQKGELTPEQEAQWAKELAAYRESLAGTPTPAGKL